MTQDQKLQKVVEAAGECWHEISQDKKVFKDAYGFFEITYCIHCNKTWDKCINKNPSPTDLNKLFKLAEKLGYYCTQIEKFGDGTYGCSLGRYDYSGFDKYSDYCASPAEALLNALYEAIKE